MSRFQNLAKGFQIIPKSRIFIYLEVGMEASEALGDEPISGTASAPPKHQILTVDIHFITARSL
jgi:hypothetical protein